MAIVSVNMKHGYRLAEGSTMKLTNCSLLISFCVLSGCASHGANEPSLWGSAESLTIAKDQDGRAAMNAVPLESAMERFSMNDAAGHNIAYIALADTDVGGVVFVDGKLIGGADKLEQFLAKQ